VSFLSCKIDCARNAAHRFDMIVLDQHAIIQAKAVVPAATHANGIFFEQPQAGQGLSRVQHFGLQTLDLLDVRCRQRGDPRQMLQQVQRHPLACKQGPRVPEQAGQLGTPVNDLTVLGKGRELNARIETAKHFPGHIDPGKHKMLLGQDHGFGRGLCRDRGLGRNVAIAPVFGKCVTDQIRDCFVRKHVLTPASSGFPRAFPVLP